MTTVTVWTALSTLGAGVILTKMIEALIGWATGRHGREQSAWDQRDAEARARRRLEETLHRTRLAALDAGMVEEDLPAWPTYDTRGPAASAD